jgi:hypothetical protein
MEMQRSRTEFAANSFLDNSDAGIILCGTRIVGALKRYD